MRGASSWPSALAKMEAGGAGGGGGGCDPTRRRRGHGSWVTRRARLASAMMGGVGRGNAVRLFLALAAPFEAPDALRGACVRAASASSISSPEKLLSAGCPERAAACTLQFFWRGEGGGGTLIGVAPWPRRGLDLAMLGVRVVVSWVLGVRVCVRARARVRVCARLCARWRRRACVSVRVRVGSWLVVWCSVARRVVWRRAVVGLRVWRFALRKPRGCCASVVEGCGFVPGITSRL